jgi:hypothetical protein
LLTLPAPSVAKGQQKQHREQVLHYEHIFSVIPENSAGRADRGASFEDE